MNDYSQGDFTSTTANADFEAALRKSFWRSILNWFFKNNNHLLDFDEIRKLIPWQGQYDRGMREIELKDVVGSVGRYQDFDRSFLPLQNRLRGRWVNVDKAHLKDIVLPPIEVYKIGSVYFVKDGNHRVSVAREKGQIYIEANVIEITTAIPIDANTNIDDLISKKEQIDFLIKTDIKTLRPGANIELTLPGGYEKLIEHIQGHRWFLGEKRKHEIPWKEAVTHWYDKVYLPLVKVIRVNHILKDFPHRSEADLYLWIIDHLWYLRQNCGEEISLEDAANNFVENFSQKPLTRIKKFFNNLIHPPIKNCTDFEETLLGNQSLPEDEKKENYEIPNHK